MSAPQFRVGDVVDWCHEGAEGRVVYVNGWRIGVRWERSWIGKSAGQVGEHGESQLTLLRRPVRVGDRLATKGADRDLLTVGDVLPGRVSYVNEDGSPNGWDGWETVLGLRVHADGTPIDPPQAEPAPRGAWVGDDRYWVDFSKWGYIVNRSLAEPVLPALDAPGPDEPSVCWWRGEETDQQRANRLADEAGALRSERDELLRENATLRRQIERLERKRGGR